MLTKRTKVPYETLMQSIWSGLFPQHSTIDGNVLILLYTVDPRSKDAALQKIDRFFETICSTIKRAGYSAEVLRKLVKGNFFKVGQRKKAASIAGGLMSLNNKKTPSVILDSKYLLASLQDCYVDRTTALFNEYGERSLTTIGVFEGCSAQDSLYDCASTAILCCLKKPSDTIESHVLFPQGDSRRRYIDQKQHLWRNWGRVYLQ